MAITVSGLNAMVARLRLAGWRLVEGDDTQDWYDGQRGQVRRMVRVCADGTIVLQRAGTSEDVLCDPDDPRVTAFIKEG